MMKRRWSGKCRQGLSEPLMPMPMLGLVFLVSGVPHYLSWKKRSMVRAKNKQGIYDLHGFNRSTFEDLTNQASEWTVQQEHRIRQAVRMSPCRSLTDWFPVRLIRTQFPVRVTKNYVRVIWRFDHRGQVQSLARFQAVLKKKRSDEEANGSSWGYPQLSSIFS